MAKRTVQSAEVRDRVTSDFPKHGMESAYRVAKVIDDLNGGKPLPPTDIAIGLKLSPGSSDFRVLLSSSLKYGWTVGSYRQDRISLTELGMRTLAPTSDDDR